jgi:mono/diheme cytochrome c family protein
MLVLFVVTVVICTLVARSVPRAPFWRGERAAATRVAAATTTERVLATIVAGDLTATRTLPTAAFRLEPGQSLHASIPPGPFTVTLAVRFDPERERDARFGAQWQGGQLIIRRGDEVLLSDHAGDEPREAMTTVPVIDLRRHEHIDIELTADPDRAVALRALWQPVGSLVPLPLPAHGPVIGKDAHHRGLVLAQRLQCAACHRSEDDGFQSLLAVSPGPDLASIGSRARPGWLRRWIRDPRGVAPDTAMPDLAHGGTLDDAAVEDLTHFLASLSGPMPAATPPPDDALVATGRALYHEIGCVACHGPIDPPPRLVTGARADELPRAWRTYAPIGPMGEKTTVSALAAFLRDPVASRPSGLMPSMQLDGLESTAIASFLVSRPHAADRAADPPFTLDPARADRGRALFGTTGCASCHTIGAEEPAVPLAAPSLESVAAGDGAAGCLADEPPPGVPAFAIDAGDRRDLGAFLASIPARRSADVPLDRLHATLDRLDCVACHAFHGDTGPEAALLAYFGSRGEADLGDEGRLPPDLTDAGGHLTAAWMNDVLAGGQRARPYIATRMPDFGAANVARLPGLFARAAGVTTLLDTEPAFALDRATAGRALVGSEGLNCIQCHEISGHDSTGTPGPDLALMPGRLRYDSFRRWLHDPVRIQPRTRMPTFFVGGRSAQTGVLGGAAGAQIDAMWAYLSQGDGLALPEGLVDPAGFELVVQSEPIVFRTFLRDAGVRAIACGFPEQIHCAFDADRCAVTAVWQGRFLGAQGAWGNRGGTQTNPDSVRWTAPPTPVLAIVGPGDAATSTRFRGYRLDDERRPIFLYDLARDDVAIDVTEQPQPRLSSGGATLVRRFTLTGPPGTEVAVHAGDLAARGAALARDDEHGLLLRLDDAGRGAFDLELSLRATASASQETTP